MDMFSTAAEHIFDHPELEEVQPVAGPSSNGDAAGGDIEEAFKVADTVRRIIDGGFKTVCSAVPVPIAQDVMRGP
jgi:diphthamide biosynthesis protein 2